MEGETDQPTITLRELTEVMTEYGGHIEGLGNGLVKWVGEE